MFNKITIVGVGLIGGSIALTAKKKRLAKEIVGVTRRESSRRKALRFKVVDRATLNLGEAVRGADLVIIASPVGKIVGLAGKCVKFMKKSAILSDVGSSKKRIVEDIEKFSYKKTNFVGAHPMAGSDKSGVENAEAGIFKDAACVLTKTARTDRRSLSRLGRFWKSLGCRVLVLSPEKHDIHASLASYLPHAVSYALSLSQKSHSVRLAAGSLKDTTRVASSDPELWKDIFLLSKGPALRAIASFMRNLEELKNAVKRQDEKAILKLLRRAKKVSDGISGR
ncbi:MAG: prephenate dehydrogenase [Candidatus Omnitrophota bacterium]